MGRTSIAIAPSNDQDLYASIAGNTGSTGSGLYQFVMSTDNGMDWSVVPGVPNYMGGQGWYDQTIAVSPTNAATVFVGGSAESNGVGAVMESTNSGATFTDITVGASGDNGPHADHHALAFTTNGELLDGDDGGIWELTNATIGSIQWADLNGTASNSALNTIQFEGGAISPTIPEQAGGGSQDNGTEVFSDSLGWTLTDGGDGGNVLISNQTPSLWYHVAPMGSFGPNDYFRVSTDSGQDWSSATNGIAGLAGTNFYPTIAIDPSNGNRVFIGGSSIAVTTNAAASWTTYASPGSRGFNGSGATVDAIVVAPSDSNTVYAATGGYFASSSNLYVTTDNGSSWTTISLPSGSGRVNELDVDPSNSQIVYAVVSNFTSARATSGGRRMAERPGPTSAATCPTCRRGR